LSLLAKELPPGSPVAHDFKDFKFAGVADSFGLIGRTQRPFRLPTVREDVVSYHEKLGYRVNCIERSSELSARLLTGLAKSGVHFLRETVSSNSRCRTDAVMADIVTEAAVTCFSTIRSGTNLIVNE
jgi:hypothetical protein